MRHTFVLVASLCSATLFACSNEVLVTPDHPNPQPGSGGASSGPGSTSPSATSTSSSGAGGGPQCCGPVQIQGPVKTVAADSDPAQYIDGTAGPMQGPVAQGPFYLTDVVGGAGNYDLITLYTVAGMDCTVMPQTTVVNELVAAGPPTMHGARIFIPSGRTLCVGPNSNAFYFAGFRPY
jgi:hypothetical protein